jgi:hypothetical protein
MTGCKEWTTYNQLHAPGTTLAVLAYTVPSNSSPPVKHASPSPAQPKGPTFWFVSIPDCCVSLQSASKVSHVVFFKPDAQ